MIQVTCPKCLKRFQVSDKFAGKTGPCPACKAPLRVPDLSEQVTIHVPDDGAPKDSRGVSVLKPITRAETDVTRKGLILTILAVAAVFVGAIAMRLIGDGSAPLWAQWLGVVVLAPPSVWAAYSFVYDRELDPYRSNELWTRVAIVSAALVSLWLVYALAPAYVLDLDRTAEMSWTAAGITFLIMIALGSMAALAAFELEFAGGLAIAGLYFFGVLLLSVVAGVTLAGLPETPRGAAGAAAIQNANR